MRASQILALAATFPRTATIIRFPPEHCDDLRSIIQRLPIGESTNPRGPSYSGCTYYLRIGDDWGSYNRTFGYDSSTYHSRLQHYDYAPTPNIVHTTRKSYVEKIPLTEGVL